MKDPTIRPWINLALVFAGIIVLFLILKIRKSIISKKKEAKKSKNYTATPHPSFPDRNMRE